MERKAYPRDVSEDEWALVAPYLTLMTAAAPQREHSLGNQGRTRIKGVGSWSGCSAICGA